VGILWDLAFDGRFLVVPSVARSRETGSCGSGGRDIGSVKYLVGGVNFFHNARIAVLA
jgi:hypothetical protein